MSAPPRILVVFFSRTGTTRKVAEAIARAAGADLEELAERTSRRGILGWLRSGYEGKYRLARKPLPLTRDPSCYDIVFVGSPTWSRALSSPVRAFLQDHAAHLAHVALFAVCAERGADDVVVQMAELLGRPPLATLTMREHDVQHGPAVWVGELVEATLSAWTKDQDSEHPPRSPSASTTRAHAGP